MKNSPAPAFWPAPPCRRNRCFHGGVVRTVIARDSARSNPRHARDHTVGIADHRHQNRHRAVAAHRADVRHALHRLAL